MDATSCIKTHDEVRGVKDWPPSYSSYFPLVDTKKSTPGQAEPNFAQALRPVSPRAWLDRPGRVPVPLSEAADSQTNEMIELRPDATEVQKSLAGRDSEYALRRKVDSVHKYSDWHALNQMEGRYESQQPLGERKQSALTATPKERISVARNPVELGKIPQRTDTQGTRMGMEPVDASQWRQQLRRVDTQAPKGRNKNSLKGPTLNTTQGSLPRTPLSLKGEKSGCNFCDPSQSTASSSHHDPPPCLMVEDPETKKRDHLFVSADNVSHGHSLTPSEWDEPIVTHSKLRLRDLEYGLARKSADDQSLVVEVQDEQDEPRIEDRQEVFWQDAQLARNPPANLELPNHKPLLPTDHACEWRARCMDLSTEVEQLRFDMGSQEAIDLRPRACRTARADVGVGDALAQHECPDFGIEGLTIVMHMRGKDDLVINTDLKQETSAWDSGNRK